MSAVLLTAVNTVLNELGELPVTSIDEPYGTIPTILTDFERTRKRLLEEGWWFNTATSKELLPDATGRVQIPENTLTFTPHERGLFWQGSLIVDRASGAEVLNRPVQGNWAYDIPMEDLVPTAREAVVYMTATNIYMQDIGKDTNSERLSGIAFSLYRRLVQQQIAQRKPSTKNRTSTRRWYAALRN